MNLMINGLPGEKPSRFLDYFTGPDSRGFDVIGFSFKPAGEKRTIYKDVILIAPDERAQVKEMIDGLYERLPIALDFFPDEKEFLKGTEFYGRHKLPFVAFSPAYDVGTGQIYEMVSESGICTVLLTPDVEQRLGNDIYKEASDALRFLNRKTLGKEKGRIYTLSDVIV